MTDLTADQQTTVRRAAYGAMSLVSQADPGFFEMFSESAAGSKVIAKAPAPIREMLTGLSMPPTGSKEQVTSAIMSDLRESMQILSADPAARDGFRDVVLEACRQVAEAKDGIAPEEQAVLDQVRAAVDSGAGPQDTVPSRPAQDGPPLI